VPPLPASRLCACLGRGIGEVYLAEHPRLPRREALKILPEAMTADTEFRQRFIREADLAATLFHPHIVGVHDRGEYDDQLYIDGLHRWHTPHSSCATGTRQVCPPMK
jgi:hypothetical protein